MPTEVWYNAHAGLTAYDLQRNSDIRQGLEKPALSETAGARVGDVTLRTHVNAEYPTTATCKGLAAFGYGKLTEACYLLLRVRNADAARAWIASAPVSTAEYRQPPPDTALQIAFTPSGLRALGVPESIDRGILA